jgi:hypothetical protein
VLVSQAIAALPEDGSWIPVARWRKAFRATSRGRRAVARAAPPVVADVETALKQRQLVELRGGNGAPPRPSLRRQERDRAPGHGTRVLRPVHQGAARQAGARRGEHRHLSAQPLPLRRPEELPEIQRRLDEAVVKIADEFARGPGPQRKFLNMLITSTPF